MTDVLFPQMSSDKEQTGVITTWFVETGDQVTPATLIAEVAVEKAAAEVHPETSGVITILEEENKELAQGAVIARVT